MELDPAQRERERRVRVPLMSDEEIERELHNLQSVKSQKWVALMEKQAKKGDERMKEHLLIHKLDRKALETERRLRKRTGTPTQSFGQPSFEHGRHDAETYIRTGEIVEQSEAQEREFIAQVQKLFGAEPDPSWLSSFRRRNHPRVRPLGHAQ